MPTLLQSWLTNHQAYEAEGRKLAVYIGPGGNAGVLGAGIVSAMQQSKSLVPNASYIGGSVGAFNWMILGQGPAGATSFGRFFCDNRYFNPFRLLTPRPPVNLDFVLNEVFEHNIPFNYTTTETSPYTIQALTTGPQGEPHLLPLSGSNKAQAQSALRHSAAMPLLARTHDITHLDGWDAYLAEPELLFHLRHNGITDVVWVLNRPLVEEISLIERLLWKHIITKARRRNPMLSGLIRQRLELGDFLKSPPSGITLEIINPVMEISALSRNSTQLFHALGTSYRWMAQYLGHPNLPYPAEWAEWQHHMPKNEYPA